MALLHKSLTMTDTYLGLFFSALLCLVCLACNDTSSLGTALVEEDRLGIGSTDTISMNFKTVPVNAIQTYDPDPLAEKTLLNSLVGNFEDPVYGLFSSSLFFQLSYYLDANPDFEDADLDSMVLLLQYDTISQYGPTNSTYSLGVYEVVETMEEDSAYFSNRRFEISPQKIGGVDNFLPQPLDSVIEITNTDTLELVPHLRIKLDETFSLNLFNEIKNRQLNETLLEESFVEEVLNGLHLRSEQSDNGFLSFRMQGNVTGLKVFYHQDTVPATYTFVVDNRTARSVYYELEQPTGIEFNSKEQADSIAFIQGMSGPNIEVEFPYLNELPADLIVNKAELELTVAIDQNDNAEVYPPPSFLVLRETDENGDLQNIVDLDIFTLNGSIVSSLLGGSLLEEMENGVELYRYRLNFPTFIQQGIEGKGSNKFFIVPFAKGEFATRAKIYGPGHSTYPAKLTVTYSRIK